uniref:Uncharacterized protein n=1 Tax=Seriola dumerili TaxID=41447 RepID=A0A3B4U4M6_SERDU
MCHVIVTCIVAAATDWLVGFPRRSDACLRPHGAPAAGEAYRPTLGIRPLYKTAPNLRAWGLLRTVAIHFERDCQRVLAGLLLSSWRRILLLCGVVAFHSLGLHQWCFQSIMKKSTSHVCGLLCKGIAGKNVARLGLGCTSARPLYTCTAGAGREFMKGGCEGALGGVGLNVLVAGRRLIRK